MIFHISVMVLIIYCHAFEKKCYLTQNGNDGFGHQVEGKLSCLLLSLYSTNIIYVHTAFHRFEHVHWNDQQIDDMENFTSIGYGSSSVAEVMSNKSNHFKIQIFKGRALFPALKRLFFRNECDSNIIHSVDNCWDIVYREPIQHISNSPDMKLQLFRRYSRYPKPDTNFSDNSLNIVMHIRGGDSGSRIMDVRYFSAGLEFYINYYSHINKSISVWLCSEDNIGLEYSQLLQSNYSRVEFIQSSATDSLQVIFHRMVMADGFIISPSSLSLSAILLSRAPIIAVPGDGYFWDMRWPWINTSYFHKVNIQKGWRNFIGHPRNGFFYGD